MLDLLWNPSCNDLGDAIQDSLFYWWRSGKGASQVAQWVKNPSAMQETQDMQILSLGQEDLLEEGMATESSILAWRIPWTEEPGRLQSMGAQKVRYDSD